MTLPIDYDSMRTGDESERTDNVESYKVTCMDFIKDISGDYLEWVEYYKLPPEEDRQRRARIAAIIEKTNLWIAKVATTIKGVDVVMNDGIQKMAEATAGQPFQIGVFVNGQSGYTKAAPGTIDITVKAAPRQGRKAMLGFHYKDDRFRLESTCKAQLIQSDLPQGQYDFLDLHLSLDASACSTRDLVSFTITIFETTDGQEADKRGVSTIVHLV